MIVSHGAGGKALKMIKSFGPYAIPYETIMLFP
jgi:hypothetical protein